MKINENAHNNARACFEEIYQEYANKGLPIEGGWQSFRLLCLPTEISEIQYREMRKAFFIGAQHLLHILLTTFEPGSTAATKADLLFMKKVQDELAAFSKTVTKS